MEPSLQSSNTSSLPLESKVILVTGAGSGIGKAVALGLAKKGATVVLLGKTLEKLNAVYDEIETAGYPQAAIAPLDLEKATEPEYLHFADVIYQEFGRLDGLIHNAAWLGELAPMELQGIENWNKVLQINLTSNFLLTKALMPALKNAPKASIVFTSSGVGRKGKAYWGPYAVSKFAIEGLMQTLADELETNTKIRVNSLNPGATLTKMRRTAFPGEKPETLPTPEQLVPAYIYLMSEQSQGVHGQALNARDLI
ncbi:MAG: YciK family oxidoreductase [Gammaproteobacteria bacterium CG22_combo_CG10-13_8_21_14_all_40_8]|nr:MAG: YciK family oxidoreductase [Gammaproteobacteria bacterium CG22_combo_CG10-13_8_21_14_all_40_8]